MGSTSARHRKFTIPEKVKMLRGALNHNYFRKHVRPMLHKKSNNDSETAHELVLEMLSEHKFHIKAMSKFMKAPEELRIQMNGKSIMPFGTAAGLDKTGDALLPLSHIFGFLEPGTITLNAREGNARPRVAADDENLDLYNAQGFPGKGLHYFLNNIKEYRKRKGKVPVYANICGMPLSEADAINLAMEEMKTLLTMLDPYVDGFVWNCASPNTEALKMLRDPQIFKETSTLMKKLAPDKLRFVKMWPYEPEDKATSLKFVESFIEGGGHGVVTTNTKMFPKEQIPAKEWGYKSAGRSGKFLKSYRIRSVKEMRHNFPNAIIVATGGIYDGDDAYETFKAGANLLQGYTPYVFYGTGLLKDIQKTVLHNLKDEGYGTLQELQDDVREGKTRNDP